MKLIFLVLLVFFALSACGRSVGDSNHETLCSSDEYAVLYGSSYNSSTPYSHDIHGYPQDDTALYHSSSPYTSNAVLPGEAEGDISAEDTYPPPIRQIPTEPDYIPLIPRWTEGEAFQLEHFLCDFDYLMHTLRINFPLFGPAYRRLGIDIDVLEQQTREAIVRTGTTTPGAFSQTLAGNFFRPFGGFGHLYQHWERRIHLVLANIYRDSIDEYGNFTSLYSQRIYEVLRAPEALRFYGYIPVNLGEYENFRIIPGNVTTEILIEGHVAYMNIRQFNHYNIDHDREIIFAFYEEIAEFGHLIIDLRQNPGGFAHYFTQLIIEPNLTTTLHGRTYEFFPAGRNNLIYADALIADMLAADPNGLTLVYNAADFVANNNMRYFNQDDLALLHNVVVWHTQIDPVVYEKAFDGKIWILIGPGSMSGAEIVAIFLRDTGFATMVGQPTAGIMGAISSYVLLPNSGIVVRYDMGYITDSYGRSFEEFGVSPHYYNRPGMDALETTLAIIEEMTYIN